MPLIVGEVGSVAQGLGTPESDHDYHGVYIEPREVIFGIQPSSGSVKYGDKANGEKTGPGDTEGMLYGLRKYAALCAQGNPTVMTLLYTPNLIVPDQIGLQANAEMFLSKRLAARHIGYANSMYRRLTGDLAPRTNRPNLIEKHGYDTKAAFHALRLLIQGFELLRTKTMTMPMDRFAVEYLMDIRNGEIPIHDVLQSIEDGRADIEWAEGHSPLPDHPDMDRINEWLIDVHAEHYDYCGREL